MSIQQLNDTATQTALGIGGGGTIFSTGVIPKTTLLSAQAPIKSAGGTIIHAFGTLSPTTYYFSGVLQVEIDDITSPPADWVVDVALTIGTSSEGVFSFSLPSTTTSYATIPVALYWTTHTADGTSPTLAWSWTPNGTYASSGGANLSLSGVMIPYSD